MRKTIPIAAATAVVLASATLGANAATTAASPAGSVLGNPSRTTTAPLVVQPNSGQSSTPPQASMDNGPFSPAAPDTLTSTANAPPTATETSSNGVTPTGPAATNVTTNPASTNASQTPFGTDSTFAIDNSNGTTGTLPGFAAGTGTAGVVGSAGTATGNGTTTGSSAVLPLDVTGAGGFIGGGVAYGGGGGAAATPAYSAGTSTTVVVPATTPTPLLNQVTNTEINREVRERAQGRTPRVIGIAPRTNVDRTNQMPDDPIIRY